VGGDREYVDEPGWFESLVGYEPVASVTDATLWLAKYQPHRLEEWLMKEHPRLREWLAHRQTP
jgi:hypothetical protein